MNDHNSDTTDLANLELQVDTLIQMVNQLKAENIALKNQQKNLVNKRANLIDKTEQARAKIESMIMRLRSMETNP